MIFFSKTSDASNFASGRGYLEAWICPVAIVLCSVALSGCASDAAKIYAQQNEAAQLRQQAEEKVPTPDNKGMYLDLILQMQDEGMYFASLAHIDAYEQKNGSTPELQRLRADALRETRQSAAADAAYRKLLNSTEAGAAWHGLGLLAAQNGDYPTAVTALREAAKRQPTNPVVLSDLGYAMLRSGDVAGARMPLAQAAELAPDNRKMIGNLALLLLVSGEPDKARQVMDKAVLSPESRTRIYSLAAEIGQRQPAVVTFQPADAVKAGVSSAIAPTAKSVNPVQLPAMPFQSMMDRFGNGG
ncbi:tetratricopeptide repeat protein [Collimonas pratensis]|nr:tetratricopeptide repeat protein [Collimonas pratensis]